MDVLALTEKEFTMIMPNNVTFGQYHITEWQENLLTLIGEKLQNHITRKEDIPLDLFNQPYIEILCDEAGGKNNKSKVKDEIKGLCQKMFTFSWVSPNIHKTIETTGNIINTYHDVKGTNKVILNFNVWAIPFLLYYGIGVGGTRFCKGIALKLRGNYTKRLYKIICSQQDREEYYYKIDKFREDFKVPERYKNFDIERMILIPSRDRIKESGSHVWFEYEMICKYPMKGRKPKADTILFRVKTKNPKEVGGEHFQQYNFVYNWLKRAFEFPTDDSVLKAVEKITDLGRLREVYERCCYYDDRVSSGQQTGTHANNSLLKMLREEFQIVKKSKKEKRETAASVKKARKVAKTNF